MSISQSLFSLVKYNAGSFKSEKQADFLLSHFVDSVYAETGKIYNSTYTWLFHANRQGVFLIEKKTDKKGIVKHWELSEESKEASLKAIAKKEEMKAFNLKDNFLQSIRCKREAYGKLLGNLVCDSEDDDIMLSMLARYKANKLVIARLNEKFNKLHGF